MTNLSLSLSHPSEELKHGVERKSAMRIAIQQRGRGGGEGPVERQRGASKALHCGNGTSPKDELLHRPLMVGNPTTAAQVVTSRIQPKTTKR